MGVASEMDERDWLGVCLFGSVLSVIVLAVTNNAEQIPYILALATAIVTALAGRNRNKGAGR